MDNMFEQVTCNSHFKKFITIDSSTFQVVCKKCIQESGNGIKNLEFKEDTSQGYNSKEEKFCFKHANKEAAFFCDSCSEFICNNCFCLDHKQHVCATFQLIIKDVKENTNKYISELANLKKEVEGNLLNISKTNSFFSLEKENLKKILNLIQQKMLKGLNAKSLELKDEIDNIFNGVDFEVENSTQRLESTRKKAQKMFLDFSGFLKEVESISSDKKVCLYKKSKDAVLEENKNFLRDLIFFINDNLEKTKLKSIKEMENFSKKSNKFLKNTEIFENSVINTISSGIPNICMRIRRFRRYFYLNSRYFKTSSLCISTSQTINLVGFSFCGLFDIKNQLDNLKLEVKLYELDEIANFEFNRPTLFTYEIKIPVIINPIDPVFQFYLKNAFTLSKNKYYYLFIGNLSSSNYIDIWTGEVARDKDEMTENQSSIICNNTNVKFNFINASGIESDFNEFSGGIVSDIIFSHTE